MTDEMRALGNAEVALLGLLAERPKHPWQIEKDVEYRDMRSWTDLSKSTIYKRLGALERSGLAAFETEIVDGRARKVYSATEVGRKALAAKLLEMLEVPQSPKWGIDLATYNLDLVPRDEAITALKAYRDKLRELVGSYRKLAEFLRSSGCPAYRTAVALRPQFLYEGDIRWVTEFIEMLETSET